MLTNLRSNAPGTSPSTLSNLAAGARLHGLRRAMLVSALAAALAGSAGCVTQPSVSVHHAELRGISMGGLSTVIFLQVRNDNSYDIQIRNVGVNVAFGRGYPLGPINFQPNQWLKAHQNTLVAVPVQIPWQIIPALVSETMGSYSIPYHVKGSADVTATRTFGIERDNYPVDEGGTIPRQLVIDSARSVIPLPIF